MNADVRNLTTDQLEAWARNILLAMVDIAGPLQSSGYVRLLEIADELSERRKAAAW